MSFVEGITTLVINSYFIRITPKSRFRLERLSARGLIPGSALRLAQRRPCFVLELGETTLALDEEIVREI
jgi:DtxR family Mn-dependent transcriptional regulator